MARQLRHHYAGGWYHITTRGMGRREIFTDDRDREHFVELLAGVVERYGVILHAYVLMENHYHLLIETPDGNASRALQWLNVSYAAWFNAKHGRCGPLFQARFKSIPVDGEGSWALTCSVYIHLNPVRVKVLGLGKEDRTREKAGFLPKELTKVQVASRLAKLRSHVWSSYPAYAGYATRPKWLTCEAVKGEPWETFADRKGDWGRDLALYVGRMRCGLTLGELGGKAGGMGVQAVSKAVARMEVRMREAPGLKRKLARVLKAIHASEKV